MNSKPTSINQRFWCSWTGPLFLPFMAIILLFSYVFPLYVKQDLGVPPYGMDGSGYDNLAVQISKGHAFTRDYSDADFRLPYEKANVDNRYDGLLSREDRSIDLKWPPVFPAVMAASFKAFGRQFVAIRIVNSAAMAIACSLSAAIILRRFGPLPAMIVFLLFAVVDPRTRFYATEVMSEAIATMLVALLVWLLIELRGSRKFAMAVCSAIVLSVAILTRTVFLLWIPFVAVAILIGTWPAPGDPGGRGKALLCASAFLTLVTLLITPYVIFNCIATKSFMPLGTHVYTLPSGYSDRSLERRGYWYSLGDSYFSEVINPGDSEFQRQIKMANYGRARAMEWVRENPSKVPQLMFWKSYYLWFPTRGIEMTFLLFPIAGLMIYPNRRERLVYLTLLAANTAGVALTWNFDDDRFQVPVLPIIHSLASVGIYSLFARSAQIDVKNI